MAETTVKRLQVVNQQGDIFTLDPSSGTEYEDATQQKHGLMSTSDKTKLDGIASGANAADIQYDPDYKKITKTINGTSSDVVSAATLKTAMQLNNVDNTSDADKPISDATQDALAEKIDYDLIGVAGGVAELDLSGKVPSSQLPSYVDDVLEYNSVGDFPLTGETGKIYVALDTNKTYRWGGSSYVLIGNSIELGETSSTAYRGDRGKTAYDHASDSGRLTTAQTSGLYKIATTAEGHVASVTAVTKEDITGLGIPGSQPDISGKADKVQNATNGNFAGLDSNGNLVDSGSKASDFLTEHQNITGKADKVQNATNGNFAGLDSNGNLTDSGSNVYDFLGANQGTENAGKYMKVGSNGAIIPDVIAINDFTGATSSSAGSHGLVPAPAVSEREKFLCGDGTWAIPSGGKLVSFDLDTVTNTSGSYTHTTSITSVTHDMKVIIIEVSNSSAFKSNISITTADGSITLDCDDVSGTSEVSVSAVFLANADPITSTEFDLLSNRIGSLSQLQTTAKSDLVAAINEHENDISGLNSLAISNITRNGTTFTATRADGTTFTFDQQDNNTTYSAISRGSGAGLAPGLPSGTGTTKYLREDGSWQVPPDNNTTYSFSNSAPTLAWNTTSTIGKVGGVDLTVKMPANPNTNTTYSFVNSAPTLSWNTTSTVGTVGGVALTVKMPANPNTNTTYSFSNGNPTLAWGTKSTVGTTGGVALTVTMPSNPVSSGSYTGYGLTLKTCRVGDVVSISLQGTVSSNLAQYAQVITNIASEFSPSVDITLVGTHTQFYIESASRIRTSLAVSSGALVRCFAVFTKK